MSDDFRSLMKRLRAGDDAAATEVFERFAFRLIELTRSHLDRRLAQKVDPEDVVQSAYKSFFLRHRDEQIEVGCWDGLWGLLTLITLRKCADRANYYHAEKRDVKREQIDPSGDDSAVAQVNLALTREPLPEEAAVMAELVEELFRDITDADERTILELSLQGYTTTEISQSTGRAQRSVRRLRELTRVRLEKMQLDGQQAT